MRKIKQQLRVCPYVLLQVMGGAVLYGGVDGDHGMV
jgi:hypothetical protein